MNPRQRTLEPKCLIMFPLIGGEKASIEEADLDIMSEFLVMASTLLSIKCRMILPREKNEAGEEEEDPLKFRNQGRGLSYLALRAVLQVDLRLITPYY